VRGNQTHAQKLREVIEAYKDLFDRHALQLLARLLSSADAVKALHYLTRNCHHYEYVCLSILTACVEAEQLAYRRCYKHGGLSKRVVLRTS
jgi:hypothetical protein